MNVITPITIFANTFKKMFTYFIIMLLLTIMVDILIRVFKVLYLFLNVDPLLTIVTLIVAFSFAFLPLRMFELIAIDGTIYLIVFLLTVLFFHLILLLIHIHLL